MDPFSVFTAKGDIFLLVLARVSGIFVLAPVFSMRFYPNLAKAGLAGILAFILCTTIPAPPAGVIPQSLLPFSFLVAGEMLIGIAIGLVAMLVFAAIQTAGQIIDMQMGFGIVNVIDPQYGIQVPLMGNFKYLIALIVYLAINGHHWLLKALFDSYQFIPVIQGAGSQGFGPVTGIMVQAFSGLFLTAFKISFPLVGAVLLVDVALGILARTLPQMNVFVVGLPLKIVTGVLMLMLLITFFVAILPALFEKNYQILQAFLAAFR